MPKDAWEFYVGGYQPAQKWLKDRKGRALTNADIEHYQKIIVVLVETGKIIDFRILFVYNIVIHRCFVDINIKIKFILSDFLKKKKIGVRNVWIFIDEFGKPEVFSAKGDNLVEKNCASKLYPWRVANS